MRLVFKEDIPFRKTVFLEKSFHPELQFSITDKRWAKENGMRFITAIDEESGKVVGDLMFITIPNLITYADDSETESFDDGLGPWLNKNAVYFYSIAVDPKHRRKGIGTALKQYTYDLLRKEGVEWVVGHAKHDGSLQMNQKFGIELHQTFENWYNTGEPVTLYSKKL